MKTISAFLLLLMVSVFSKGQMPGPTVVVAGRVRCGVELFVVVQVSNVSRHGSIALPLSPLHQLGYTIHDIRIEVKEKGQWHYLERGLDLPAAGVRELRPGESLRDQVLLQSINDASPRFKLPLRIEVPYLATGLRQEVKTKEFSVQDLLSKKDFTCPAKLNGQ